MTKLFFLWVVGSTLALAQQCCTEVVEGFCGRNCKCLVAGPYSCLQWETPPNCCLKADDYACLRYCSTKSPSAPTQLANKFPTPIPPTSKPTLHPTIRKNVTCDPAFCQKMTDAAKISPYIKDPKPSYYCDASNTYCVEWCLANGQGYCPPGKICTAKMISGFPSWYSQCEPDPKKTPHPTVGSPKSECFARCDRNCEYSTDIWCNSYQSLCQQSCYNLSDTMRPTTPPPTPPTTSPPSNPPTTSPPSNPPTNPTTAPPTNAPPTNSPPTNSPPTNSPKVPTAAPVAPTAAPETPTNAPETPTAAPETPTAASTPIQGLSAANNLVLGVGFWSTLSLLAVSLF